MYVEHFIEQNKIMWRIVYVEHNVNRFMEHALEQVVLAL
jgi:hypothetical protein